MDLPDYDPNLDSPPLTDADIDALDTLLQALPSDNPMNVEALDGYLTALIVGPQQPLRSAVWMPPVWGGDGAANAPFASAKQKKRVVVWLLRHLHAIDRQLRDAPDAWEAVLSVAEAGDGAERVDAEDWCIGFLHAVGLAPDAWEPLFDDAGLGLEPLALLGADDGALSDADRARLADPDERDAISRAVLDAVLRLNARRLGRPPP